MEKDTVTSERLNCGKEFACNEGDLGSVPELIRCPGEGNRNPLQYMTWRIPWTENHGGLQSMR